MTSAVHPNGLEVWGRNAECRENFVQRVHDLQLWVCRLSQELKHAK